MNRMLFCTVAFTFYLGVPSWLRGEDDMSLLEKRTFKGADSKAVLRYRLLKPDDYDPKESYPLVLFLHGAGERGDDNEKQLIHGVPQFVKRRKDYPCFLVAPQCPNNIRWVEVDWAADAHKQPAEMSEPMKLTFDLLAALPKEFAIDTKRIYVTGLSMGGYGTWDMIARRPELFAAAVIVCGGGDEATAGKIAKLPQWIFHGAKDGAVKPSRSRNMVEALKKAGGNPKYTEYPEVGHDAWKPAYQDSELYKWLFAQKRE
jgi:predicted peptidase